MKKFLRNNKNIQKIVLIMTAVSAIIRTLFSSLVLNRVIKSHDEEMLKFIAADIYDDINTELLKIVMITRVMSKDTLIIEQLRLEENFTFDENVSRLQSYLFAMKNAFNLSTAFIVSEKSRAYYLPEGFNKFVDVDNDKHDIWYKLFRDKNLAYDFDIDVDEVNGNKWTIFVNARIEGETGNLLGVCGVGVDVTGLQNLLLTSEHAYNVTINLVNQNGAIQLNTNTVNIEQAHIQDVINPNKTTQFVLTKGDGVYTITKYMPDLGLYLVVRRDAENSSAFSNLIFYMVVSFIIASLIFLIFVSLAMKVDREQVEETARKHGLASYADLYISMHLIDLKDNLIHEISKNPAYDLISIDGTGNADEQLLNSSKEISTLDSLTAMLDFVDLSTLAERLRESRVIQCEFRSREYGWCKAYFIFIEHNKNREISQIVFAIELIDEEKNRENELIYLSQTDLMTGLRNRGSGEKTMQDLMSAGVEGMFCLMDADKFKSINDNYGHDVGDKVIKAIADCLKKTFRNTDVTMRLGGDEFAVYVVGVTDETYGAVIIEDFFDEINALEIPELGGRKITISLGAAFFTVAENLSFAKVYKHADFAAYAGKKVPGNTYNFYRD